MMTGSGALVYGLYKEEKAAGAAAEALEKKAWARIPI